MKTKRGAAPRKTAGKPTGTARKPRRSVAGADPREPRRRSAEAPPQQGPARTRTRDPRALQHGPATAPSRRPVRPKNSTQAKARAKARKAKAPKVVRVPLRERLLTWLASIELNPRTLAARVPFVVLVIGALGLGLGVTLWLSTDAAERSYQLGSARETNRTLLQQKEALERDVLEAQAAPALAEAARNLGMIPSRDTAHLVQDPAGNWIVVGNPKPAEGVPPPPLNTPLPDDAPAPQAAAPTTPLERPVRIPTIPVIPGPAAPAANPEVIVRAPEPAPPAEHAPAAVPGVPLLGPPPGPVEIPPPAEVPAGAPMPAGPA